jgi:hypothetical protein
MAPEVKVTGVCMIVSIEFNLRYKGNSFADNFKKISTTY